MNNKVYIDDIGTSDDCINVSSFGEICIGCGCCSYNPNYRDRIIHQIRYYKEMLKHEQSFDIYGEHEQIRKMQEENIKANILYFKREIRLCKKILRTLKRK